MEALLNLLKIHFTDHASIVAAVGTKCAFLTELQSETPPFITYNVQQLATTTKDGSKDYNLVIIIVAKTLTNLITIYDTVESVILTDTANLYPVLQGSSFPEILEDYDDNYIIDLTFNINK